MAVTETLGALGSWDVQVREDTPDYIIDQLGFFGHIAIADGSVDVEAVGDGLLTSARYVGVLRAKDKDTGRTLSGSGMVFWLGDEDGKGDIIESQITLTGATLSAAVTAILGPSNAVTVGTVHAIGGTFTGKFVFMTRREALAQVCDAFNAEFRVNGDASVDVGTAAHLYNTEAPDTVIVRKGAGTDMGLVALGGDYTVGESAVDYSSRVVLLGQTVGTGEQPDAIFASSALTAASVPYLNLRGSTINMTRVISESGTTSGSVLARTNLALNRFSRVARSLNVSAEEFETEGNFVVGDNVYVYDPDTGVVNTANEVTFRGEVLHPDIVRARGITWPVARGMTVAFRTQAGVWLDLSPYVTYETGGNALTVGDLPQTLSKPGDNPVQVRVDAGRKPEVPWVVADDIFNGAVGSLKLADLAVIDAKVNDLAVNKVTAGVMSAAITISGQFATALSGQRAGINSLGHFAFNSSGTQTLRLNGSSNLIMGEVQTAGSGTRLIINPDGSQPDQIRFYPSSGSNYAKIETRTFSGSALIDGVAGGSGATGQFGAHPQEGYVRWGDPTTQNPNSFVTTRQFETQVSGPIVNLTADERFAVSGGGTRRIEFYRVDTLGAQAAASVLRLLWNAGGYPWLAGTGANCGMVFQSSAKIGVVDNAGNATAIQASAFEIVSSRTAKDEVQPIAAILDPLGVVKAAPSYRWRYTFEKERDAQAPVRFGPMAEDLPTALRRAFTGTDGTPLPGTDVSSLLGVLWGAVGQLSDRLSVLETRVPL